MAKLTIMDRCGDWVEPFEKVTINGATVACKFCQAAYEKKHRCNRDFTSKQKKEFHIPKGEKALRLVLNNGPTGTAYICMSCCCKLFNNLRDQVER